ncbi:hypothetical protein [Nocardioides litoris]|uniref:hypothetical protein n=1 Tax=Nocardioides litoris TaxID=1926648 RepID=UPI0011241510|nr:hypothetical protein [Nocardioides litoris]
MARRVSLPAADDLFRPTVAPGEPDPAEGKPQVRAVPDRPDDAADEPDGAEGTPAKKRASGRIKHDEKMTVYVTSEELLDLERTRLELRGEHGLAVDRGRLVREAIDLVLADFHARGAESMLVRGLLEE